jgi:Dihydropteroate synthase and related enzymes
LTHGRRRWPSKPSGQGPTSSTTSRASVSTPISPERLRNPERAWFSPTSRGRPGTCRRIPGTTTPWGDILCYFEERLSLAEKAGIPAERILLDPGLGFGKRREDNLRILRNLDAFRIFGRPLLIGHSRKGFIGATLGLADPEDRLEGTLAVTALCGLHNVALVRVHDVEGNARVLSMLSAVGECLE